MYKVLSVDLDWLLGNMQNKWAEFDGETLPHLTNNQYWQVVSWETGIPLNELTHDVDKLKSLSAYLYLCGKLSSLEAKTVVINEHHEIYPILNNHKDIYLVNIDHHHDIIYRSEMQEKVDCGNWVYHLARQGKLRSYSWIGNSESEKYKLKDDFNIESHCTYHETYSEKLYMMEERFDLVVICKSGKYTPKSVQKNADSLATIFLMGTKRGDE